MYFSNSPYASRTKLAPQSHYANSNPQGSSQVQHIVIEINTEITKCSNMFQPVTWEPSWSLERCTCRTCRSLGATELHTDVDDLPLDETTTRPWQIVQHRRGWWAWWNAVKHAVEQRNSSKCHWKLFEEKNPRAWEAAGIWPYRTLLGLKAILFLDQCILICIFLYLVCLYLWHILSSQSESWRLRGWGVSVPACWRASEAKTSNKSTERSVASGALLYIEGAFYDIARPRSLRSLDHFQFQPRLVLHISASELHQSVILPRLQPLEDLQRLTSEISMRLHHLICLETFRHPHKTRVAGANIDSPRRQKFTSLLNIFSSWHCTSHGARLQDTLWPKASITRCSQDLAKQETAMDF